MRRSWGFWLLLLGALAACGGRSNLGLPGDAYGGSAANGGAVGVAGRGGGAGALGGAAGRGGSSAGGAGGASAGRPTGGTLGGGAGGTGGTVTGGSAGSRPNLSDDTSLYSLEVAEGYLAPKFDSKAFDYWVTIPRGAQSLTVEALANDPDATVEVAGEPAVGPIEVMATGSGTLPIVVTAPSGSSGTTYLSYAEELVESTTYLKPSSTSEYATFGVSVAVSGDTVAVGAYTEVGPDENAVLGPTGAVYVYVKDDDGWRQEAYLTPGHRDLYDQFGYSVALSGDTLVIGAPGEDGSSSGLNGDETDDGEEAAGAAYVFVRDDRGTWTQQAYVKGVTPERNAYFGTSVALEGDALVVGSPGQSGPDDGFGQPSAAGSATVLVRDGESWSVQQTLGASNPSDLAQFGMSVSLSGDTLAVGAPGKTSGTEFGGSPAAGAAYVLVRSGTSWSEQAFIESQLPRANAYFGTGIAVSDDVLVVGEPSARGGFSPDGAAILEAGAAYVYERHNDAWNQLTALLPSNAGESHHFGARVAVEGGLVVVGAPGETGSSSGVNGDPSRGGAYLSGAAYVFARTQAGGWYQAEYLKAVTSDPYDGFGISVSLADGMLAVGAHGEASQATGVNGDSTDDSVQGAGAAYVYELAE